MAKAHKPDILGEWAKENGFDQIARAFHPREVERRRQQAIKSYNERPRKIEEEERRRSAPFQYK